MDKLYLLPDADGYNSADPENSISVSLEGGASRVRLDKIGGSKIVSVTWTMNPYEYEYWRAFYTHTIDYGSLPFLLDLLSEDGKGPVEHECSIVPGSVQLPQQKGFTYVQQATLEVRPLPLDPIRAEAIVQNAESILMAGGRLTGFAP